MVTLEQVDQLRKRTNCSYEEAKELLEKHSGDVLESIVDFEKNRKGKSHSYNRNQDDFLGNIEHRSRGNFWSKVREVIQLGFDSGIVVEDNKGILMNIPINIMLLLVIFIPFITIPIFILLLFLGYRVSCRKAKGGEINISAMMKDVTDRFAGKGKYQPPKQPESHEVVSTPEKDDYNEMTIE